jgi:hypothetical protein
MGFLASFLAFASSSLVQSERATQTIIQFLLLHPSVCVGLTAIGALMWAELGRTRKSDDLFTRIGFGDGDYQGAQADFVAATIDELFRQMIANSRIVVEFIQRKIFWYNTASALFVFAVALFVFGY